MPAGFSITDEDIAYAESILLPAGESFDGERRAFIRILDTIDLQAVPGSGKTTALLAKLLILDRYLPFPDGSGVLVISHTNAAIDEIRDKIGSRCANLFRYPNFVGTIQAFVDEFLAVPYYANRFRKVPLRIDDGIYNQKFSVPPFKITGFTDPENKNARYYLYLMASKKRIRWGTEDDKIVLTDGCGGKAIEFKKPKGNTRPENYTDWSEAEKARVASWISEFKAQILKAGFMCYDDAYFLASLSLRKNPLVRELLRKRFAYVFVDEMQDMERHQHDLLEHVFFDGASKSCAYQRIGDKNQGIFDGKDASAQAFWRDRATMLQLSGSYRLSPVVAAIVGPFAVSQLKIEGRQKQADGTAVSVRPRLIVYSDATMDQAIPRFASIVRDLLGSGEIPAGQKNRYKAIAWATEKGEGKVRLCDYYPGFSREEQQQKPDYPDLGSYVEYYDKEDRTMSSIEANISNALLRVLREEGVTNPDGMPYSKARMRGFLRETRPEYWTAYQCQMYEWCVYVLGGLGETALGKIQASLPEFLRQFGGKVDRSTGFIYNRGNGKPIPAVGKKGGEAANSFTRDGVTVEIATVHRVKGETHAATLYMESFYERGGGGNYESERLAGQLKEGVLPTEPHNLVVQSAKMVYVGFSRPTHLLCFAVHENRFAKLEADMAPGLWEVVRL
jgi:DNA helicase-2/ATP-dependent DNA helicase PcrA